MKTVASKKTPEILKFKHGKFVLCEVSTPKLRLKLAKDPRWKSLANDSFETGDLGAASVYRGWGSELVQKIFKRTFQEFYLPPKCEFRFPGLLDHLDPHQKDGLQWILTRKRSYLVHAPGAGKTAQAILGAVLADGEGQAVFIVPPSLTLNWEREIRKVTEWCGVWISTGIIPTTPYQWNAPWRADFLIVPDSMMSKNWVYTRLLAMKKKFIAVDEASRFKDPTAERSLAFYGGWRQTDVAEKIDFPGLFKDARHVVFLDGSPMPNRPMELWAPAYALDPESIDCMDQNDFGYRYCGTKPNDRGVWEFLYSSNEAELQRKLTKTFMHVVTESELSHPERRRSIVVMSEDARSIEHRKWERKHLGTLKVRSEYSSQGDLARFRRQLGVRKIPWIARYVKSRLQEKNESILLFAWHREVVEGLAKALERFHPGVIMGGTKEVDREQSFDLFQRGIIKLLILNIAAGGRGHNLQRADRVIFGEFSWTDETNKQCEKRSSRKGSEKDFVRCEYIVSPNSIDEVVLSSVFTKEKRVGRIIG